MHAGSSPRPWSCNGILRSNFRKKAVTRLALSARW
jgi:hypothetical protein